MKFQIRTFGNIRECNTDTDVLTTCWTSMLVPLMIVGSYLNYKGVQFRSEKENL